jgi:hypothetical protein
MASNSPDHSNRPWLQIAIALISLIGVLGAALIANHYFANNPVPNTSDTRTSTLTVSPSNPGLDDTGVSIHQGNDIQISARPEDTWSCYSGVTVGAGGDSTHSNSNASLTSAPFCSLIARVGINGPLLPIGIKPHFIANTSGDLYLGANDVLPINCPLPNKNQCYTDNTGQINVTIMVKDNA